MPTTQENAGDTDGSETGEAQETEETYDEDDLVTVILYIGDATEKRLLCTSGRLQRS